MSSRYFANLESHYLDTKALVKQLSSDDVARWLLTRGYFPEGYVLPPSFYVGDFELGTECYYDDLSDLGRRQIASISYPKTDLTFREFGILHPWNYHDIVFYIHKNWLELIEHIFPEEQKIYTYSFPIPVTKNKSGNLGNLRAGRMIYEWLSMAEKHLILDAGKYQYLARTDISNFYASIYTHSIPWALHGREEALQDSASRDLYGNKIDRLLQYSNDRRTNGIAVGPALTDLIAEILLAAVDVEVSRKIGDSIDFVGTRFKDDYRILCQSERDAHSAIQTLAEVLRQYNLVLNERKTNISRLPDGIYRAHDREYFPHSIKDLNSVSFKIFEHTLLIVMDIHRRNPGTSILEKFVSELFDKDKKLKIIFSNRSSKRAEEIKKMIELLFFAKRESQKLLCHVLAVCQELFIDYRKEFGELKPYLAERIKYELRKASEKGSTFEVVWYIFFSRFAGIGINDFTSYLHPESNRNNEFYKSIITSRQKIFSDSQINLFRTPKECREKRLVQHISVFD